MYVLAAETPFLFDELGSPVVADGNRTELYFPGKSFS